jgi:hypothetical protein
VRTFSFEPTAYTAASAEITNRHSREAAISIIGPPRSGLVQQALTSSNPPKPPDPKIFA